MIRSRRGDSAFAGVVCAAIGAMALASSSGAAPAASVDLAGSRLQTVERIARSYAAAMGDRHPLGALIVASHRLRANRLTNGDIVNSNEPVYVVQINGRIDHLAGVPPGQPLPRGNTIELTIERSSLKITDDSLSNTKNISHLGHPAPLALG